jgi:hypothetical protein
VRIRGVLMIIIAVVGLAGARPAMAQVACSTLPNPLYLQIGDTQEPLIKALGKQLRDSTVNPMTVIYITAGSCTNIDAIYNGTKITVNPKYIPSATEDPAWTPTSASPSCTIDAGGVDIDIANSNVLLDACGTTPTPAGLGVFQGPIQGYVFVTPKASSQTAITAEEAYFVFGFGALGQALPWIDEAFMFIRTVTKSTLLSMAAAIGVPAAKWKGVRYDKSTEVLNAVASSTDPEKTIGILGVEIYDVNRATVSTLAYRAYQQDFAYYPDSTSTSLDKQNIRDGHYTVWSPTVYLTKVDGGGVPTNARAKYLLDLILGNVVAPDPGFDSLSVVISKGLVPICAMKVTRSFEGGPLSLYDPAEPCHCYFESQVGTAPASCTVCTDDGPCGSGKCRHGYCEAR